MKLQKWPVSRARSCQIFAFTALNFRLLSYCGTAEFRRMMQTGSVEFGGWRSHKQLRTELRRFPPPRSSYPIVFAMPLFHHQHRTVPPESFVFRNCRSFRMDGSQSPPFTIQRPSASCVESRGIPHGYLDSSIRSFHKNYPAKIVKKRKFNDVFRRLIAVGNPNT